MDALNGEGKDEMDVIFDYAYPTLQHTLLRRDILTPTGTHLFNTHTHLSFLIQYKHTHVSSHSSTHTFSSSPPTTSQFIDQNQWGFLP